MLPNEQKPIDPKLSPAQPGRHTMIQPLSSEDDIRQAAVSANASRHLSESDGYLSHVDSLDITQIAPDERENSYEASLITEQAQRLDQTSSRYGEARVQPTPNISKMKKPKFKIIAIILIVLAIGILGVVVWLFFNRTSADHTTQESTNRVPVSNLTQESVNGVNRESSADLTQEQFGQSTYLRPKEWVDVSPKWEDTSRSASAYANAKDTGYGEMTAIIAMSDFSGELAIDATSEKERSNLRNYFMNTMPDYILGASMLVNAPIGCDSGTFAVTRSENTTKMKTTIGIIDADATCKKGSIPVTMKMRVVAGLNDGRARMIVTAVTDSEWRKNEKTFQQILDSVEEYKKS